MLILEQFLVSRPDNLTAKTGTVFDSAPMFDGVLVNYNVFISFQRLPIALV